MCTAVLCQHAGAASGLSGNRLSFQATVPTHVNVSFQVFVCVCPVYMGVSVAVKGNVRAQECLYMCMCEEALE